MRARPRAGPTAGDDCRTAAARARSPSRACSPRSSAPTTPAPRRWSRICSPSPASRRSADAAPAKSPIASSNRRPARRRPTSAPNSRRSCRRFLAISGDPDAASRQLRALAARRAARSRRRARLVRSARRFPRRARAADRRIRLFRRASCATSTITPASSSRRSTPPRRTRKPAIGGGRYDGLARRLGAADDMPAVGAAIWIDRLPLTGARA